MIENKLNKLNKEYDYVMETITKAREEFGEIRAFADGEHIKLEDKLLKLKIEVNLIHTRIENLKDGIKASKAKLRILKKGVQGNLPREIDCIKKEIEKNSLILVDEEKKILKIIKKQEALRKDLDYLSNLVALSSKKSQDMNVVYNILAGKNNEDVQRIEQEPNLEFWGIQVLEAQELERKRIAREMHDGPTQNLSNLLFKTELCIRLFDKDINRTKLELNSLKLLIRSIIDETRRLISNLRPMLIDDLGLVPTLERLIDEIKTEYCVELVTRFEECKHIEFDPVVSLAVYRISQEAINNIKKHSKATRITFELRIENEIIILRIIDNGIGFELNCIKENNDDNKGFGISMMRERTVLLNGQFQISSQKNIGTTIIIKLPLNIRRKAQKDE